MQGFFRILPTRPGEELPPQRRLRVFRVVVLGLVFFDLAALIRSISTFIQRIETQKQSFTWWYLPWWSETGGIVLQAICVYLMLEMMEILESRTQAQLNAQEQLNEIRFWELPYVILFGVLGGLYVVQWIAVGMMLDWKAFHGGLHNALFVFMSMWCIGEMLRYMNRQCALASRANAVGQPYSFTPWLLALPLTYYTVRLLTTDSLLYEMMGCAYTMILLTSSYWPHAEGIHLFLNIQSRTLDLLYLIPYLPFLWSLGMIHMANRYRFPMPLSGWTARKRRLMLGAGIMLAFIWPSLPRWLLPDLTRKHPQTKLSTLQLSLLIVFPLFIALSTAELWGRGWNSFIWHWTNQPVTCLMIAHPPCWLCGAMYELILLWNSSQTQTEMTCDGPAAQNV